MKKKENNAEQQQQALDLTTAAANESINQNQVIDLINNALASNNKQILTAVCKLLNESTPKILEAFQPIIEQGLFVQMQSEIKQAIENAPYATPQMEIKLPDGNNNKVTGITHEKLQEVIQCVAADIPCYLYGPAGTGKSEICQQAAKGLNLDFYSENAIHQDYQLTGFIDANGVYHETEFYRAFKNGGLFFLDEMDASIPEALTILNSALANKYFPFPNGRVQAHEKFKVICAGNTLGKGADAEYTGRMQLDAATLNRFAVKIHIDYSEKIEKAVTNNNGELIEFCHECRKNAAEAGYNFLFTYRDLKAISILEQVETDTKNILLKTVFAGICEDDTKIIINGIGENKYADALAV